MKKMHNLIFKNLKSCYIIAILFYNTINSIAQVSNEPNKYLPNIIPPSPTAFALGNYGNIPIGMFAGSPNIHIPVLTYKTTNLEVPIQMFYSSINYYINKYL